MAHGRIVAARADGPGSAMRMRLINVESDRSRPRAADPGRPDMEVTRVDGQYRTTVRGPATLTGTESPIRTKHTHDPLPAAVTAAERDFSIPKQLCTAAHVRRGSI